ncbi:MAG: response regulator [Candidatus Wallbacteria bacterium]|nr:response regulator [Candidatus Wallbacteria bacterium]
MDASPATSSAHILIVEDSEFQSRFYRKLLEKAGYTVEVAGSGEEGLVALGAHRPDLILLDVQLPGVDGFHVCAAVRDGTQTHDIPIIILSSKTEVPSVMAGLRTGADDYVGKQTDTGSLVARIARLLERTRTYRRVSDGERLNLLQHAAATLSPGIREPARAALTAVKVLEGMHFAHERQARAARYLRQYLQRILRLVENIEDVSRLASEAFVERKKLLDVETALDEAEHHARYADDLDAER